MCWDNNLFTVVVFRIKPNQYTTLHSKEWLQCNHSTSTNAAFQQLSHFQILYECSKFFHSTMNLPLLTTPSVQVAHSKSVIVLGVLSSCTKAFCSILKGLLDNASAVKLSLPDRYTISTQLIPELYTTTSHVYYLHVFTAEWSFVYLSLYGHRDSSGSV